MKEELISFETAKLAKEKGFHERVIYYYIDSTKCVDRIAPGAHSHLHVSNKKEGYHSAPTQSLLQRWLRKVYGIHVWVVPNLLWQTYHFEGLVDRKNTHKSNLTFSDDLMKDTYEQALEAGLLEALKLIEV